MKQKYYEKAILVHHPPKMPEVQIHTVPFEINHLRGFGIKGRIPIFGKDFNYYDDEINWHTDIFTDKKFPLIFSKSINIRNSQNVSAKVVWEINRMQFLTLIAINYRLKRNEKDLKVFMQLINSWVKQNPFMLGINWYSNIEVNIRLIVWYFCWNILNVDEISKKNSEFKIFVDKVWLPSIYQHCSYSFNNPSKFSSSNNHLISEYAGLFVASSLWQFNESVAWNKFAKEGLEKEILRQHSPNGINKEEAAEYIQFITDFFLIACIVGKRSNNSFSDTYISRLHKIIHYVAEILDEKGNFPKYGDEDDGKCILFSEDESFNNFKSLVTSGAILYNDSFLRAKTEKIDIKNLIFFGKEGLQKFEKMKKVTEKPKSKFYRNEGHFIFRHSVNNKEVFLHFDAAPLGYLSIAAHGHADALSFILHVGGKPIFIDPGTYTYHTDYSWRKYFIGTLAHNTMRVNQINQAEIAGPTLWLNHYRTTIINADSNVDHDIVEAKHDGYKDTGIVHTREITLKKSKNLIKIKDTVECLKQGEFFLEFPYHLHPEVSVKRNNRRNFQILDPEGQLVYLVLDKKLNPEIVKGQVSPQLLGWNSRSFMQKEPSNTIYCTSTISSTQTFESLILIK